MCMRNYDQRSKGASVKERLSAKRAVTQEPPRLIDAPETRGSLERMVGRLTSHSLWCEDLVQEALIHLWQEERRRPGQSACWYLRSCQFHVLNQMRHGRSIDSPKRRNGSVVLRDDDAGSYAFLDSLVDSTEDASVLEVVIARDLLSVLMQELTWVEGEILICLADGLSARETARRLNLSHTCVTKKRRRIAALVAELERENCPKNSTDHPDGRSYKPGQSGRLAVQSLHRRPPSRFQFDARITSLTKSKEQFREGPTFNAIRP